MIVFKGNKRLFDKIIDENNTSTLSEHIRKFTLKADGTEAYGVIA